MNQLITQNTDRLALALVVCVLVLSVFFGVIPLTNTVRDVRSMSEKERIAQDVRMEWIAQTDRMRQEQEIIAQNMAAIPTVPTEAQIITMVESLEQRADKQAIVARFAALSEDQIAIMQQNARAKTESDTETSDESSAKTSAATTSSGMEKYFSITLVGSFGDVADFIRVLENAPYYIFMDSVILTPQRKTQKSVGVTGVVLAVSGDINDTTLALDGDTDHVLATITARIPFVEEDKSVTK